MINKNSLILSRWEIINTGDSKIHKKKKYTGIITEVVMLMLLHRPQKHVWRCRYTLTSEKIREPAEVVQIHCNHKQQTASLHVLFICWLAVFSLYLTAKLLILKRSLPYTSIFSYLCVRWWFLRTLLNQVPALVFGKFSLFSLKLQITCACWAFANLTLRIFRANIF